MGLPTLRKPNAETIDRFLAAQAELPFTYTGVGSTAGTPPPGYVVDRYRIKLGEGERAFALAKDAVRRWEQFHLGWVECSAPETPIRTGAVVAILGRGAGMWWLNACRIVYTMDEVGSICKFGFAYGTLPGHAETGEERFQVEWNRDDDSVWYDIIAFSRPHHILARLGYPAVRRLQKRFGRDSASAMLEAVVRYR